MSGVLFCAEGGIFFGRMCCARVEDMVKACHKADIEVVLEMPFAAGISEQEAAECLRFYMMEYHVDGFVVNPYIVSWELLNKDPFLKGNSFDAQR